MNKTTHKLFRLTTGLLLSTSLTISSITVSASTAEPQDREAQFSSLHRIYDSVDNGLIQYHYEDESGQKVDLNNEENDTTSKHTTKKRAANLPSSYDLRSQNVITSIKDQGITGSCWAFAAIKSAESNLITKKLQKNDTLDLSESHLAWYTYHPSATVSDPLYKEGFSYTSSLLNEDAFNEGGNALLATFTLARWSGTVSEEAAPFHGSTTSELSEMIASMSQKNETLRYQKEYLVTDVLCYDSASRDEIKEAIMQNGAMDVSYYHNNQYFNTIHNSYYQEQIKSQAAADKANHSVSIVGWDDNYSRENFGIYKPSSDGAWLIANSYGESFGEMGYSWISYEEPTLVEYYSFLASPSDTYDNNYQYDGYGWGNPIVNLSSDTTEAANIFTANTDYNQSLDAVGIYTIGDNQPYTIKIYQGVSAGKPTSGTLVSVTSGTQAYQGYHTVPLKESVSLKAGERFSVVISYQRTTEENGYIPLEGPSEKNFSYSITYTSNPGESYLYDSSEKDWIDTSSSHSRSIKNNVCIKAFTKNTTPADKNNTSQATPEPDNNNTQNTPASISLSQSSITLGKGESYTVASTVKNGSDETIFYESSDASVATVSNTGKITTKAEGTAIIKATLSSGASAKLTVTVKKAPSKITVTPATKKAIAVKKSFRIKVSLPKGSASHKITYSSSKPSVATVSSDGKVKGKKKGKTIIKIKTFNGKTAKITVTVK